MYAGKSTARLTYLDQEKDKTLVEFADSKVVWSFDIQRQVVDVMLRKQSLNLINLKCLKGVF